MRIQVNKWLFSALLLAVPAVMNAQFNTVKKKEFTGYELIKTEKKDSLQSEIQQIDTIPETADLTEPIKTYKREDFAAARKYAVRKKHLAHKQDVTGLPDLTINNLLEEIRRNGIRHEKIVLAQAILETGWFTSSVCRNKHNLFGLTNPRTGQYYEFNHWTESVRAYYSKVQYRYKGGNYLIWLKDIGYAEDPRYVSSLIQILRQYML